MPHAGREISARYINDLERRIEALEGMRVTAPLEMVASGNNRCLRITETQTTAATPMLVQITSGVGLVYNYPYNEIDSFLITNVTNANPAVITHNLGAKPFITGQIVEIDSTGLSALDGKYFTVLVIDSTHFSINVASGGTATTGSCFPAYAYAWQEMMIDAISGQTVVKPGGKTGTVGNGAAFEISDNQIPFYDPHNPLQEFPFNTYLTPSFTVTIPVGSSWSSTTTAQCYSFQMPGFVGGINYTFQPNITGGGAPVPLPAASQRIAWQVINDFTINGTHMLTAHFDYACYGASWAAGGTSFSAAGVIGFTMCINRPLNGLGNPVNVSTGETKGTICGEVYMEGVYDFGNYGGSAVGFQTVYLDCIITGGSDTVTLTGGSTTTNLEPGMYVNGVDLIKSITNSTSFKLENNAGSSSSGFVAIMPTYQIFAHPVYPSATDSFAPYNYCYMISYGPINPIVPTVGPT